jgi:arsenical pump membrane protein
MDDEVIGFGIQVRTTGRSQHIAAAALIGVDLGPNLSITGSLATILWLAVLRREGQSVSAWRFLRLGAVVTFPALVLAIMTLVAGLS